MCDPAHDDGMHNGPPANLDEWDTMKSKKLDVLVKLVKHHLGDDNRHPFKVDNDELVENKDELPPHPEKSAPDKIVVYSAFPSNNFLILKVCFEMINTHAPFHSVC